MLDEDGETGVMSVGSVVFVCCCTQVAENNDASAVSKRRRSIPKRYLVCHCLQLSCCNVLVVQFVFLLLSRNVH